MSSSDYSVVFTTTETESDARALASQLVEAQLVACAQIVAIQSIFSWEGKVNDASESLLLLKTRTDLYEKLEAYLQEHHPYDVPEILQVPVTAGFGPYLNWMNENTTAA